VLSWAKVGEYMIPCSVTAAERSFSPYFLVDVSLLFCKVWKIPESSTKKGFTVADYRDLYVGRYKKEKNGGSPHKIYSKVCHGIPPNVLRSTCSSLQSTGKLAGKALSSRVWPTICMVSKYPC
jgi:hypothetical protein